MGQKKALELARNVDHIYAGKGKLLTHLDLTATKPSKAQLLAVLLGPTGNLRAPTMRVGRVLLVGFNEEAYEDVLG